MNAAGASRGVVSDFLRDTVLGLVGGAPGGGDTAFTDTCRSSVSIEHSSSKLILPKSSLDLAEVHWYRVKGEAHCPFIDST